VPVDFNKLVPATEGTKTFVREKEGVTNTSWSFRTGNS